MRGRDLSSDIEETGCTLDHCAGMGLLVVSPLVVGRSKQSDGLEQMIDACSDTRVMVLRRFHADGDRPRASVL
jgi:hypothetical protein